MCGIYGSIKHYEKNILIKKLQSMSFRGPDNMGLNQYEDFGKKITLGHVRLSIIDLDKRSNQPFDYSVNTSIVFNGEIYNYRELKKRFLNDISFRTTSDTEVICAMYEKFGVKCLEYFNGMFAFVIYDKKKHILFGARDRLGKKPFYYVNDWKNFEFASQLTPLVIGNSFEIDPKARLQYLVLSNIPEPLSIYSQVNKLEAGCYFEFSLEKNTIEINRYWDIFSNTSKFSKPKNYQEAKEMIEELLFDSIRLRLNADVPVGIFLSGGIDSSLVAAIACKLSSNVSCFSIGFNQTYYDESVYAKQVAQNLHNNPSHIISICTEQDSFEILGNLFNYFDEPFADQSQIPSSLVASNASKYTKAAMGGDGGDEIFLGYNYYHNLKENEWKFNNPIIRKLLKIACLPFNEYRAKSDMFCLNNIYLSALFKRFYNHHGAEKYSLLEFVYDLPHIDLINIERGALSISDYDIKRYLNDNGNVKVDRSTMRSSLELRSPIMDYRIVEYSRLLPYEYFYDKKTGPKRILRDILYKYLPQTIFERPKQGFGAPVGSWLSKKLKEDVIDYVTEESIKLHLPELKAKSYIKYRDTILKYGSEGKSYSLWVIYVYLKWIEKHNI